MIVTLPRKANSTHLLPSQGKRTSMQDPSPHKTGMQRNAAISVLVVVVVEVTRSRIIHPPSLRSNMQIFFFGSFCFDVDQACAWLASYWYEPCWFTARIAVLNYTVPASKLFNKCERKRTTADKKKGQAIYSAALLLR